MYEHIRYEVEEPIATLTLHRPERLLEHLTCTMAEAEQDAVQRMLESFSRPDFREGVASFLEKRSARFERLGS